MKKAYLTRYGAYGDHIHMSNAIRALDEAGYHITFEYNFKGAQIHTYNPRIDTHAYFEPWTKKNQEPDNVAAHNKLHERLVDEVDLYVNFGSSIEDALIAAESSVDYFWPLWMRRDKNSEICYYDQSMRWAGLTDPKYMGWSGEIYFPADEQEIAREQLAPHENKFIILWAFRGTMQQKAMYPLAQEICDRWLEKYPNSVIITTGDDFCKTWEWDTPYGETISPAGGLGDGKASLIHKSGRMPFRQALCLSQYVDLVVTPETGLGIGAGAFGTPKIMLLTAASLKNIVGNDKNDYSLQSDAWCSPCTRAIYNTNNCEMKGGHPICVHFDKDLVFDQMETVFNDGRERP